MTNSPRHSKDSERWEELITLVKMLIAIELYRSGVSIDAIAKRLRLRNRAVSSFVVGVKRDGTQ